MERCNPRHVFPINMCGCHGSRHTQTKQPPTHLGLSLICYCAGKTTSSCSSVIGRAGQRNHHAQRSCTGRGRIRFLEAIFVTARLLRQILHHGSFNSSLVARRGSSFSTRTSSGQSSSSSGRHRQGTASHVRFLLSNHVLHI
jgi:hypothetical protein